MGAMQLKSLLGPEVIALAASGEIEVAGITADSRQVRPGWLFAARLSMNNRGAGVFINRLSGLKRTTALENPRYKRRCKLS